jgi:hypothetical protein
LVACFDHSQQDLEIPKQVLRSCVGLPGKL